MSLKDDIARDLKAIHFNGNDYATTVTYTSILGNDRKRVAVILDYSITRGGYESDVIGTHDEATIYKADVNSLRRGDTLDTGSDVYTLVSPVIEDDSVATWILDKT